MSHLPSHPLPAAWHDEDGDHVRPTIPEWVRAADPKSSDYDPNRAVRGSEVERDQRQKALFASHLEEHHRRGEPDRIKEVPQA